MERPTHLDCKKCFPQHGWGWRATRKGKIKWEEGETPTKKDLKGVCFACAGTGLIPIPMEEVFSTRPLHWLWDDEDAGEWLGEDA
jgi:hypothetical protein